MEWYLLTARIVILLRWEISSYQDHYLQQESKKQKCIPPGRNGGCDPSGRVGNFPMPVQLATIQRS